MVQKKTRQDSRLLARMTVPWEVVEASVEAVQPSEEDLRKVFIRWSACRRSLTEDGDRLPPRRAFSHSGDSILRSVDISPDFSSFTAGTSPRKGRERSISCPLGPRTTLTRRRKNTDFDSIIRDISDDSLYLRFKNSHTTSANSKVDRNNNTCAGLIKCNSPSVSLVSSNSELASEDDIWTDISLDVEMPGETHGGAGRGPGAGPDPPSPAVDAKPSHTELSDEYWTFTHDVYRTLTEDGSVCWGTSCMPAPLSLEQETSDDGDGARARLMGELLEDIYPKAVTTGHQVSRRRSDLSHHPPGRGPRKTLVRFHSESAGFSVDTRPLPEESTLPFSTITEHQLAAKRGWELVCLAEEMRVHILDCGRRLVAELELREDLRTRRAEYCDVLTAYLQAASYKRSNTTAYINKSADAQVKFSVDPPGPGDTGFTEWATAMKMVARLPEGVPQHFRKQLWLTLAEKHLTSRGVAWSQTERSLFNESSNPGDEELSVQIVKDLHRTGCSLFCGVSGQHNQAVLKRVLLAFARWNKNVGYCQGLNMLAALILQVMQGSQTSTVKVMIFLIEGVLPESYFGQNLRGLSVDMAVLRDLMRLRLPQLSSHLDHLQHESKEPGTSYEPPLMDVFTMQWLLTIFSNCLPQSTVLRVWDLLFLEGNHVLLKTALAIWQYFSDRIMLVKSADEFYSSMAVYTREMLELGLLDPNNLIRAIDTLSIPEVAELREKYVYNITPWTVATVAKKGLRLLYDPYDSDDEHHNNWSEGSDGYGRGGKDSKMTPFSNHPDREKIALDISVLKKQYLKLRERQRQAHIIFTAACSNDGLASNSSPALNHLLLGKSALLSMKGRRIEGTVPPPLNKGKVEVSGETLHWRDATDDRLSRPRRDSRNNKIVFQQRDAERASRFRSLSSSSSTSSSTELCDDSSESGDDIPMDQSSTVESLTVLRVDQESVTPEELISPTDEGICTDERSASPIREVCSVVDVISLVEEVVNPEVPTEDTVRPSCDVSPVKDLTPDLVHNVDITSEGISIYSDARVGDVADIEKTDNDNRYNRKTDSGPDGERDISIRSSTPDDEISLHDDHIIEVIQPIVDTAFPGTIEVESIDGSHSDDRTDIPRPDDGTYDGIPDDEMTECDQNDRHIIADEESSPTGAGRRNSERALMQILRENSEILRRIQSQSAVRTAGIDDSDEQTEKDDIIRELKLEVYRNSMRSLDRDMREPEDISEIRRKYCINKQRSLDSTPRRLCDSADKPKSLDLPPASARTYGPFPVRSPRRKVSQLGVQLGLYTRDS